MFNRGHYVAQGKKTKKSAPITSYDTLLPGDFVVHIDHGIAKFCGVKRIQTTGTHQDCMELLYQDNVKVYVPIEDFHKVRKYIGKDASAPLLSKIGTARWEKQKAKARESLREMADKLVGLYARRHYLEGIQFSADSVWQKEFEESFMFEPTPDHLTAIEQVKKDMMSSKPMDRLVCGDVGFGKTEIAMRAAFKAAMDGYQVALLAPTTILAAQHLATFSQRMANYPLRVAGLSRFQNSKEQREIVKNIQTGAIHIVIGTHRILSKDIAFHNLGLLIIDEEQRFGVIHKEKLKQYRFSVDVLSMTATPIPRTLHLSLIGIRDLSIINTPPKNRLPIETHVLEQHDEIVHGAIENELERGGQVYVVDNRIKNLPHLQDIIERAVPRARVALAHGQMEETRLETIMKEFVAGKHDVLLSTAIIESGLDIPNVNTLIVNHAEHLGLSQLYQLRGRVGRSAEQAYAYFLVKSLKHISETSLKRLRALQQYTDLGSGFQIAMRDLENRGAGTILGAEQHDVIASSAS
ncbi:MAG: DEAD/DEAH box helicase, partial [Spirochaetales bacterium]